MCGLMSIWNELRTWDRCERLLICVQSRVDRTDGQSYNIRRQESSWGISLQ